jgi:hypothetical protein
MKTTTIMALLFLWTTTVVAQDKANQIPENYRGNWVLRLYSEDGGKSYKSGGNQPICEVSASEVKFVKKVDFSDEKLVVKSVTKAEGDKTVIYMVRFENGKVWKIYELSGSINAIIMDGEKEIYRMTVRKK